MKNVGEFAKTSKTGMLKSYIELWRTKMKSDTKDIPTLYSRKEECCGCTACFAICPANAITMVEDCEGFDYPQINKNLCICCYRCLQVCPIKMKK